jgi:tetratricopeptide (TPR) repeat protein
VESGEYGRAEEIIQKISVPIYRARCLIRLAEARREQGDIEEAFSLLRESLELAREFRKNFGMDGIFVQIAIDYFRWGERKEAEQLKQEIFRSAANGKNALSRNHDYTSIISEFARAGLVRFAIEAEKAADYNYSSSARQYLARAMTEAGMFEEALKYMEEWCFISTISENIACMAVICQEKNLSPGKDENRIIHRILHEPD